VDVQQSAKDKRR